MQGMAPDVCLCSALRKASRAVTQFYDDELRAVGLRSTQFNLLAAIYQLGEANVSRLAEEFLLDQTTLTRSLGLMQKNGWLRRVTSKDGRLRVLKLTEAGGELLRRAFPLWAKAQRRMREGMGEERWNETQRVLTGVVAELQPKA